MKSPIYIKYAWLLLAAALPAQNPSYVNINRIINSIADEQNVEPGSWEWLQGGVAAFSGQTGEHSSYGWRHHHKVFPDYIRAVIANYGHRRTYYLNAPMRQYGYEIGGRPVGWEPELPGDLENGMGAYITSTGIVAVSGPEVEHFWLDPLFAVMDSPPVEVKALGRKYPSTELAKIMASLQIQSMLGQIRQSPGEIYPWTYGDRSNSRIIDTIVQGTKRSIITFAQDVKTSLDFIELCLKEYERAPGIGENNRNPIEGMFHVNTFNSLHWLLPVFYDTWSITPPGPQKDRLYAIVRRWSQWCLDLEETVPGRGFDMSGFYVPEEGFQITPNGKPVESIKSLLDPNNITFDNGLSWELWAFRACAVAAEVLQHPTMIQARDTLKAKLTGANPSWLVGYDRRYINPVLP